MARSSPRAGADSPGETAETRDIREEPAKHETMYETAHGNGHDEEDPLDLGIQEAFGIGRGRDERPSPSVLEIAGRDQKVARILLREVEQDASAVIHPRRSDAAEYPEQIDRYHVLGEIARGGVGVILRARDLDLGREVALKVLLQKYQEHPEMVHRFLEEAQIGGQLQHPGIVPIHEIGIYDGDRPYLAMKLVRGHTLAELLESRAAPDHERQRFLSIFEQVCQTLAYAHSKGVIHRDLKPSNVMVGPFGEVQVMDWGLAKVLPRGGVADERQTTRVVPEEAAVSTWRSEDLGSNSIAGSVMGTPAYMPPEQAQGNVRDLDERSDVFGLGAILCEVLTGQPPYTGASIDEVYHKAREADLSPALARLAKCGADEDLLELARACLRVNARERPRNAVVVAKRLQAYLESLESRARELEVRTAKARLKLVLAVFAICGLVLGGSGYIVLDRARREQAALSLRAIDKAVLEAERLRAQASAGRDLSTWEAALHEASRAADLASGQASETVIERVRALRNALAREVKDQRALAELDRLKEDRGSFSEELLRSFQEVFAGIGIEVETATVADAATTLRESAIASSLVVALDQWLLLVHGGRLRRKLFEIAQAADGDAWRRKLRAAVMEGDEVELSRLADEAVERDLDPSTLELLAAALSPRRHRERIHSPEASRKAEIVWRRAQESHPDDFWVNIRLGRFLREKGALDEGLQYLRTAVALRPESAYARYELGSVLMEKGDAAAAMAELARSILLDPNLPFGRPYHRLAELLASAPPEVERSDLETLIAHLQRIRDRGSRYPFDGLYQLLGEALAWTGDLRSAVRVLEDSIRQHGASPPPFGPPVRVLRAEQLDGFRRRLLPDLVSYASVDALLDGPTPQSTAGALDAFRALERQEADPILLYAEARALEKEGRLTEAVETLRRVIASDSTLPEPFLLLAESLRALGDPAEAEGILRGALRIESVRCPAVWELWVEVSFAELGRSPRELLESMPEMPAGAGDRLESYGHDLHWLLARCAAGRDVLINCGGDEYRAKDGSLWGRDRFYTRGSRSFFGRVYFGGISGTDDDPLYQTERWFPRAHEVRGRRLVLRGRPPPGGGPRPSPPPPREPLAAGGPSAAGYRIPLPPGRYEVVLHFAEIYEPAEERVEFVRSFDVRIEGRTVLEGYEPMRRGFAVAEAFRVKAAVEDGFLDLELSHRSEHPKISAIAVRPAR